MLYLLGGASRAGKSTLARRLLRERGVPYFPLDALMMGLANGAPVFGVDPDTSSEVRAAKLWPIIRAMAVNFLEEQTTHPTYLLEGDVLLPRHIAELVGEYGSRVAVCFVGYTDVESAAKLRQIRETDADWYDWAPDAEVLAFLAEEVEFSRYLQRECAEHSLRYFDCSDDVTRAAEAAYAHLASADDTGRSNSR